MLRLRDFLSVQDAIKLLEYLAPNSLCKQVTVRMAKVRSRPVPFPLNESGGQLWTYPAFSTAAQETRDGGGTWEGAAPDDLGRRRCGSSRCWPNES